MEQKKNSTRTALRDMEQEKQHRNSRERHGTDTTALEMQGETWNSNNSNGTAWRNIEQEQQQWNSRERHETGRTEREQQEET